MRWVIAYDVSLNRNRSRIARRLEQIGFRRQFSVFEGDSSPGEIQDLIAELQVFLDPRTDCLTAWPTHETPNAPLYHAGRTRDVTGRDWTLI